MKKRLGSIKISKSITRANIRPNIRGGSPINCINNINKDLGAFIVCLPLAVFFISNERFYL
jgi:hypothetical protein